MNVKKSVIYNLEKCYSVAPLKYKGKEHLLVAAEKINECVLFDINGNKVDTIWKEPGGVMSMVQVPNSDGVFLATQKFYSPNDSKEAKIVIVSPPKSDNNDNNWEVRTLVNLPHIHRFDIIEKNGLNYLIACTLKSGHNFKDDWSFPGKVYFCILPQNLDEFNEENQLKLEVIKDDMTKNHGYYRLFEDGEQKAIISSNEGVFKFSLPNKEGESWKIEKLIDYPTSDAVLIDLDGDGKKELFTISHFHGDVINVYKEENGIYKKVYTYENANFAHSLFAGNIEETPVVIIGHRQGEKNLIMFTYDKEKNEYVYKFIDENCGSANIYHFKRDNKDCILSTNREIDEVAIYEITL